MVLIDVVERAVEALRSAGQLDRREVAVTGERVLVEADAGRMEQVMTNLLVNAVKYTDTGGKISIQVGVEEDHAVVRVADDGIGINAELLPHLFDVFVQGRQSLDRARGGLGIGLALVQKLVVLQGGTIEATSPGEGEGSTFIVRLPKIEKASSIGNHTPAPRMAVPPLRVLLVEDNAEAREMLHVLLEMAGHVVYEAADGPQAIERAIEVRPEVVLVDLGLPGFDGFEVARRLRSDLNGHRFSIIAVTGYGQDEDRRRTAESGFDAHLVKPVMVERLDAVLAAAARQRSEPVGIE